MRLTRVLVAGTAAALLASTLVAQKPKTVRAKHCAASDSLRFPKNLFSGTVRGAYYRDRDVTRFLTGGAGQMRVTASAEADGKTWTGVPPIMLSVFIRGAEVSVVRTDPPPYRIALVLDNSPAIDLGPALAGTFEGPSFIAPTIPLSILVPPEHLLSLVRAKTSAIRIGKIDVPVEAAERADIAALYTLLACGGR